MSEWDIDDNDHDNDMMTFSFNHDEVRIKITKVMARQFVLSKQNKKILETKLDYHVFKLQVFFGI